MHTPYTLHLTLDTLHPEPYTLHPEPYTLDPEPCTLHPEPSTLEQDGTEAQLLTRTAAYLEERIALDAW